MSQGSSFITRWLPNPACVSPKNNTNSIEDNNSNNNENDCCDANDSNNGDALNNTTVNYERSEVMTWLSPLDIHRRHYDLQTLRVTSVGDWLLRTEQFLNWRNGGDQGELQKAVIFCSGNPGVGKTYISSLVIDSLCDEAGEVGEDMGVACFYFDFASQGMQSAVNVLGALLKQVVNCFGEIPHQIMDAFEKQKKVIDGRRLQLPEIVELLGSLSSSQPTFFCLDALDECAVVERAKILLAFRDITKLSTTTRVFLTGRPHIGGEVDNHLLAGVVAVSVSPLDNDITRYIRTKLAQDATSDEMDERLEAEIEREILRTSSEMFQLVSMELDAILQETTVRRRRERLTKGADGRDLDGTYSATIGRIRAEGGQRSRLGIAALMWISHSERPLGAEELCQALAVEMGSTDYIEENVPSIRTVLSCCQGFVVVDDQGSTVRLIHPTLKGYLTSLPGLFLNPHSEIAKTCLKYLNSQYVISLSASDFQTTSYPPFLEYSALYWGTHMERDPLMGGETLALDLFSHYERHISIKLLLEHTKSRYSLESSLNVRMFTRLHCASMLGLVELVRALIEMDGIEINGMDGMGATPLAWAAISGHERVVKLLLGRRNISPELSNCMRTPLSWAAGNGHEAVVKLLLERGDVNPNLVGYNDRTPIFWAARNGHEAVVAVLLGRKDIKPDEPDLNGQTPMSRAAENGHEAVVKLLLGRGDVNPNKLDNHSRAPILWASRNGRAAVVSLLLQLRGVESGKQDYRGRTPILWAAENGHAAVVKLLLERKDVKPDGPNGGGRTPISLAAGNGHEAVVMLLLGCNDIKPDMPDNGWGQTPISWAAEKGHEEIVKLLLRREDIDPDGRDKWGRTPISLAAMNGQDGVVKLLLGQENVNPDRPDRWGFTSLSYAATGGDPRVSELMKHLKTLSVPPTNPPEI